MNKTCQKEWKISPGFRKVSKNPGEDLIEPWAPAGKAPCLSLKKNVFLRGKTPPHNHNTQHTTHITQHTTHNTQRTKQRRNSSPSIDRHAQVHKPWTDGQVGLAEATHIIQLSLYVTHYCIVAKPSQ
eukprot:GSChrysophyteH1.ASY1.ANO1.597.1 assembled CDS